MPAIRPRRVFATPFVATIAVLPACGGHPAGPQAPEPRPVAGVVDASPAPSPADAEPASALGPPEDPNIHWNPPPPQPVASRDLVWTINRTGSGEDAACTAQQVAEPCARGHDRHKAKPCPKPPVVFHLCPLGDQGREPDDLRFPIQIHQAKGSTDCFIVGMDPPWQTYCGDEWNPDEP